MVVSVIADAVATLLRYLEERPPVSDANLHVGSGIYLVYPEHISAIPIEKVETQ